MFARSLLLECRYFTWQSTSVGVYVDDCVKCRPEIYLNCHMIHA